MRRTHTEGSPRGTCATIHLLALAFFLPAVIAPGPAFGGETYYVRSGGSDFDDGRTPATAFASLQHAMTILRSPGDTLIVGPGTYIEEDLQPAGNGSREQPIVIRADPTGTETGDPSGPVTIRPPATDADTDTESTSGFRLEGKHDVAIDGFHIETATGPGILVGPHPITGIDSTRIAIAANSVLGSQNHGIGVHAVGDIAIHDNYIACSERRSGSRAAAIFVRRGNEQAARPWIAANRIEDCEYGIRAEELRDATIIGNEVSASDYAISVSSAHGITLQDNIIRSSRMAAFTLYATDIRLVGNSADRDRWDHSSLHGSGRVQVSRNSFASLSPDIYTSAGTTLEVDDNILTFAWVRGEDTHVTIRGNEGNSLAVEGVRRIEAEHNRFTAHVRLRAGELVEARENQFGNLDAAGETLTLERNEVDTELRGTAIELLARDNSAGSIRFQRQPRRPRATDRERSVIESNHARSEFRIIGTDIEARDNTAGSQLTVLAYARAEVTDTSAAGLRCDIQSDGGVVDLRRNRIDGGNGMVVRGARSGQVVGNEVVGSTIAGITVRRATGLRIATNHITGSAGAGISLDLGAVLTGDCDDDGQVTVDEILRAVDIVLGQQSLEDCLAIDGNGDGEATVDEVILAIDAALGDAPESSNAPTEVSWNRIEGSGSTGIDAVTATALHISSNVVLRSAKVGIAVRGARNRPAVSIHGNVAGSNGGEGMFLRDSDAADVRDNIVFSNRESGILVRSSDAVSIVNNLIYANDNDGIGFGTGGSGGRPTTGGMVMNNTLYGNGDWGVVIGDHRTNARGITLLNNILTGNQSGGIAVDHDSTAGLFVGFNLHDGRYGSGVQPSVTDFRADPRFANPTGDDGILGGEGFADDDFRLLPGSAAIDAGSATAAELGIQGSAVAGASSDDGIVDLGFHYQEDSALGIE